MQLKVAQTSVAQTSVTQTSVAQTSVTQTSVTQTSVAQTSVAQTSVTQTSVTQTSVAHASVAHASVAHASVTHASVAQTSVAQTSVAHASVTHASVTQTSVTQTSVTQTSVAQTSVAQTSVAQTSVTQTSVTQTSVTHASVAQTSVTQTSVTQKTSLLFRFLARRMENLSVGKKCLINLSSYSSLRTQNELRQPRINVDAIRRKSWKSPTLTEAILLQWLQITIMPKHYMSLAKWYILMRLMKIDGMNVRTASISLSTNKRLSIINQTLTTMKTKITINAIFAVFFFALFVAALVGVIRGAWWHTGTAAICFTMFTILRKETKKCQDED
jgi:hypothetical protein